MPTQRKEEPLPTPAGTDDAGTSPTTSTEQRPFPSFVIDGHQDIAWNALEFGRDPLKGATSSRSEEVGTGIPSLVGDRTSSLNEWKAGRLAVIFASVFVMPRRLAYPGWQRMTYATPEEAESRALEQLRFYGQLTSHNAQLCLVTARTDLETVISTWEVSDRTDDAMIGLVLLMEGADPIVNPGALQGWFENGLRMVGPAWAATRYSGGTGEPGPLTPQGRDLLAAMAELGMVLDLSHMSEAAYLEAVDGYSGPIIASHSNPRVFLPTDRGLSDEMIRMLAARNGVMGIVPYNRFLKPGWRRGDSRESITANTVADAIDHVAQLVGSIANVALGSDFDGGFGLDSLPQSMETVADLVQIAEPLLRRGYTKQHVEAIFNGNWIRILRSGLPAGSATPVAREAHRRSPSTERNPWVA